MITVWAERHYDSSPVLDFPDDEYYSVTTPTLFCHQFTLAMSGIWCVPDATGRAGDGPFMKGARGSYVTNVCPILYVRKSAFVQDTTIKFSKIITRVIISVFVELVGYCF